MHREWDFEADEQRPVKQSFCGSLRRDAHLKCFILTFLIAGCLAAIFWCRLTVVRRLEDSLSSSSASLASSVASHSYFTFPASGDSSRSSEAHYSPCNDGYVYIPVAFVIMLYLVYLVECWHSHTRIELQYKVDINSVYDKVRDMREGLPIIWWKAICYHYVRRTRQVTRYRNGDAFTSTQVYYERVNTCTAGSAFNFTQCGVKDISKLLYGLENYPATKIRFSKGFSFVNVESESEFEDQRSQFFQEYESRDDYMEGREGMDILNVNFKEYMIAFADPDNLPWYVSHIMFWIASFLLLSWPLRVIIEYKTAHLHYHVHKLFGTNYADDDLYRLGTLSRVSTMTSAELDMNTRNNNVMVPSYSEALLMNTVQCCSSSARSGTDRRDSKILCGLSTRRDSRPMSGGKASRSLFALSTWTEPRYALGLSTSRSFANTATPPNHGITFVPGSMPSITLTSVRQFNSYNTINNYDKLSEGAPATRNDYRDKLLEHEIPTPTSSGIIRDNTNNSFTNKEVFNQRGNRGNVGKTKPLSYSHFSGFGPDPVSVSGTDPVSDNGIISANTAVPLNKNLESFALALDSLCTSTDIQTGSVKTHINLTGTRTKSRVVTHFHGEDRVTTPTKSDPLADNIYSLEHVLHINGPEYLSSTIVHGLFTYESQRSIESVSPLYTEAPPTYNEALFMPTALKYDRQGPRNSRQKCSSDDEGIAPRLHHSPSLKLYQRAHAAHLLSLNSGYKERRPELNCGCQEWRPERVIQRETSGLGGYRDVTCTKNSSYSLPKGQPQIFPLKTTARVPKSISLRDFQNCCMPSTSICNKKVIAVSKILQNKSHEPVAVCSIIPRKRLVSMPTNECHDEQKKTCKQSGAMSPLFCDFPSHVELKDKTKSVLDEDCDTVCILGGNGDSGNVLGRDGIKHNIRCRIGDMFGRDHVSNVLVPLPSVKLPEHHLDYDNVENRRKVRIYKSFTQSHLAQLTSTQQLSSCTQAQLTSCTQALSSNQSQLCCNQKQLTSCTQALPSNQSQLCCNQKQLTSCTQALPSNQSQLCCNQKQLTSCTQALPSNRSQLWCNQEQLSEDSRADSLPKGQGHSRADSLPKEKHVVRVNHRPHTNQSTVTNIRLLSPSTAQRCYGSVNCMETSL